MVTLRDRLHDVRSAIQGWGAFWLLLIALSYVFLSLWLNDLFAVWSVMLASRPQYVTASLFLMIATAILLGINGILIARHISFRKKMVAHGGLAAIGISTGLIGSACSACAVGVAPILLGSLGTAFSLSTLPFFGLELSVLAVLLLGVSTVCLTNDSLACPVPRRKHGRR